MNSNNNTTFIILIIVAFAVGFMLGRLTAGPEVIDTSTTRTSVTNTTPVTPTPSNVPAETTTVPATALTAEQRAMLEGIGVDPNNFQITPEMVACAETRLGAERVGEIAGGASPSMTEKAQLVACYTTS